MHLRGRASRLLSASNTAAGVWPSTTSSAEGVASSRVLREHDKGEPLIGVAGGDVAGDDGALFKIASDHNASRGGAGAVALLGPEPAFREIRRSNLDYIEVRKPADVLTALHQLKEQPALYSAMIANGKRRFTEFSAETITEKWLTMLSGPVADEYNRWRDENISLKFARYAHRSLQTKLARKVYMSNIFEGPRIMD